ncbi:hypothetical protein [Bacillus cereus]|uniref:hypothetical protein n=1 Tax=Bacillus cereus TaxID=1396 RepID=UPI000B4B124F|nr:hypothetical protein [Bacillus cereus]
MKTFKKTIISLAVISLSALSLFGAYKLLFVENNEENLLVFTLTVSMLLISFIMWNDALKK